MTVTVNCSKGLMTLHETGSLTFDIGTGFLDAKMTFHGTLDSINRAFTTLTYRPKMDQEGSDEIQIFVYDVGVDESYGPSHTVSKSIHVTISALNPAPKLSVPSKYQATRDRMAVIPGINVGGSNDAPFFKVTLSCKYGKLWLKSLKGLHILQGRAAGAREMSFLGTHQYVSNGLRGLQYLCSSDDHCSSATDTLSLTLENNRDRIVHSSSIVRLQQLRRCRGLDLARAKRPIKRVSNDPERPTYTHTLCCVCVL